MRRVAAPYKVLINKIVQTPWADDICSYIIVIIRNIDTTVYILYPHSRPPTYKHIPISCRNEKILPTKAVDRICCFTRSVYFDAADAGFSIQR